MFSSAWAIDCSSSAFVLKTWAIHDRWVSSRTVRGVNFSDKYAVPNRGHHTPFPTSTLVHDIGTIWTFLPISWRHYEQSAFRFFTVVFATSWRSKSHAKKIQNDTTDNNNLKPSYIPGMVLHLLSKGTRSSPYDCSSWRSFQWCLLFKRT